MNLTKLFRTALLLIIALSCNSIHAKQPLDRVVAIVNNEVITHSELDRYINIVLADMGPQAAKLPPREELEHQVLERLISERVQLQLAKEYGIDTDSFAVTEAIQEIARQQGKTMEALKNEIESQGTSFNDFRDLIRTQMTIQTLQAREVGPDISIAKHEVDSFLNSAAGQDQSGNEYKLGHILLPIPEAPTADVLKKAQAEAEQLVAELKAGQDFSKAAVTKSAGKHALNGGDLGWRTSAEIPGLFANYVPSMQVGDLIGPLRTSGGMHIIKLLDKRDGKQPQQTETRVSQIVVAPSNSVSSEEAKSIIDGLYQQLKQGAKFKEIATKYSHDKRSADKGGDIGWITDDLVTDSFAKEIGKLSKGEYSQPFWCDESWIIVKIEGRRTQGPNDEAARNRAIDILTMRKGNEAIEAWGKRIRDEAQVEILLSAKQ